MQQIKEEAEETDEFDISTGSEFVNLSDSTLHSFETVKVEPQVSTAQNEMGNLEEVLDGKDIEDTPAGNREYRCEVCRKSFSRSSYLVAHMSTHTGDSKYVCDICGKCFTQTSNLKRHKVCHTGAFPFSCDICSKPFSEKNKLQKHMCSHTGAFPFSCEVCKKPFSHISNLKRHLKTHSHQFSGYDSDGLIAENDNMPTHSKSLQDRNISGEIKSEDVDKSFQDANAL
ncbi:hypothetical protein C0J52_07446 [Blattella germanica]|nr:hypothetical protein C0J52_07446 [Blattella germanica]